MPSVDVVSELDMQEVDNAVNTVIKEIQTRYDFRGTKTELELNKKDKTIKLVTEDDMRLRAIKEMLSSRFIARKLDPRVLDFTKEEEATLGMKRVQVKLKEGLTGDDACWHQVRRHVRLLCCMVPRPHLLETPSPSHSGVGYHETSLCHAAGNLLDDQSLFHVCPAACYV